MTLVDPSVLARWPADSVTVTWELRPAGNHLTVHEGEELADGLAAVSAELRAGEVTVGLPPGRRPR